MTAAILFRFHASIELCRERLKLIRHINPTLPIYGLFGGPKGEFPQARTALTTLLDGMSVISTTDTNWKWLHQDLAVREWFIRYGYKLDFDCLYDHEYDLLLTEPLETLMPTARGRCVALSGLKRLKEVRYDWYWTSVEPFAYHFERYTAFMRRQYGLEVQTYVSQGPFPVLSRQFLEAICTASYPDEFFRMVNCETSYPGMAEALGFEIVDTGLHPGWTAGAPSVSASKLFHCEKDPLVGVEQIAKELKNPNGRRAFHPVKELITYPTMISLLERSG